MEVAGIDIWKGRWAVVVLSEGRFQRAFVAPTIQEAVAQLPRAAAIGVDIPIGLPMPGDRRPADEMARAYVGPRWQSVFMTPSLDLLEAGTHARANQIALAEGRRGISAQTYALRGMILQVKPVAEGDERIHEVHPEVSFVRANGGSPLPWSKSSWNGVHLRRQILAAQRVILPDDLGAVGGVGCADVLDAAVAAWSAHRLAGGRAVRFPDGSGRTGAIWS
jgi:predicted RNase H-like nuclease